TGPGSFLPRTRPRGLIYSPYRIPGRDRSRSHLLARPSRFAGPTRCKPHRVPPSRSLRAHTHLGRPYAPHRGPLSSKVTATRFEPVLRFQEATCWGATPIP